MGVTRPPDMLEETSNGVWLSRSTNDAVKHSLGRDTAILREACLSVGDWF